MHGTQSPEGWLAWISGILLVLAEVALVNIILMLASALVSGGLSVH